MTPWQPAATEIESQTVLITPKLHKDERTGIMTDFQWRIRPSGLGGIESLSRNASTPGLQHFRILVQVQQNFADGVEELFRVDWFGDVAIHACLKTTLAIAFHCMGCQRNDGGMP